MTRGKKKSTATQSSQRRSYNQSRNSSVASTQSANFIEHIDTDIPTTDVLDLEQSQSNPSILGRKLPDDVSASDQASGSNDFNESRPGPSSLKRRQPDDLNSSINEPVAKDPKSAAEHEAENIKLLKKKMILIEGDITTIEADAIVNAANEKLQRGGGVDYAIHQAAGPRLQLACNKLNGCEVGGAKVTKAFDIQTAKLIIHTVGPQCQNDVVTDVKKQQLFSCYLLSLKAAVLNKAKSIAFPAISTGVYGYPPEEAAKVAVAAVKNFLLESTNGKSIEKVIFCVYGQSQKDIYTNVLYNATTASSNDQLMTVDDVTDMLANIGEIDRDTEMFKEDKTVAVSRTKKQQSTASNEATETTMFNDTQPGSSRMPASTHAPLTTVNKDYQSGRLQWPAETPALRFSKDNVTIMNDPLHSDDFYQFESLDDEYEDPDYSKCRFEDPAMTNITQNNWFNDATIMAFMASLIPFACKMVFRKIAVLDSIYTEAYKRHPVTTNIRNYLHVYPEGPELILCPLQIVAGHWTLMVVNVIQNTAVYFDTLAVGQKVPLITADEESICKQILQSLYAADICYEGTEFKRANPSTYNMQIDGSSCGPLICLIAEHIAFKGYSNRYISINIIAERQRILSIMEKLYDLNKNQSVKTSINEWPKPVNSSSHRFRPPAIPNVPKLAAVNNLINYVAAPKPLPKTVITPLRRSQRRRPKGPDDDRKRRTKIKSLQQRRIPLALNSSRIDPEEYYLGKMDKVCGCKALLYKAESSSKCCANGTVPVQKFGPKPLQWSTLENIKEFTLYREVMNDLMCFGSCQTKNENKLGARFIVGTHTYKTSDATPNNIGKLTYHQNYTTDDPNEASKNRENDMAKYNVKASHQPGFKQAIGILEAMLREYHPLADLLKNTKTVLDDYTAIAEAKGEPMKRVYLVWQSGSDKTTHSHCLNLPNLKGQVFSIYQSEDGNPPPPGIMYGVSNDGSNQIIHLADYNPLAKAAAFPLIFVYGEKGWIPGMKKYKNNKPVEPPAAASASLDTDSTQSVVSTPNPQHDSSDVTPLSTTQATFTTDNVIQDGNISDGDSQIDGSEDENIGDKDETVIDKNGKKVHATVTKLQFTRSKIFARSADERDSYHPTTSQGSLSQKYWCVCENEISSDNLKFIHDIQEKYADHLETCKVLRAILQKRVDTDPALQGKQVGKIYRMTTKMRGSKPYMQEKFKDSIAICNRFGSPTIFATMTGNPSWPEIQEGLRTHGNVKENWIDRPDLVVRVFKLKAEELLRDILKRHVLGRVKGYSITLEHQKRGMPHLHMLLIMDDDYKFETPEKVDDLIVATIPELPHDDDGRSVEEVEEQQRYYNSVMTYMNHDPSRCAAVCGPSKNPSRNPDLCGKGFPKPWSEKTIMREDGYAELKRPDDGIIGVKPSTKKQPRIPITNQYIVPHNRYLILKYNCHINLEHCGGIRAIKYLYKYINKGYDQAFFSVKQETIAPADPNNPNQPKIINYDEIEQYRRLRVKGACEAVTRLLGLFVTKQSHVVEKLPVHLKGAHILHFDGNAEQKDLEKLCENDGTSDTLPAVSKLTAFFKLVQEELKLVDQNKLERDDETQSYNLFYHQLPEYYRWVEKSKKWVRRINQWNAIGRLRSVLPSNKECYCLRELLKDIKGPSCYEDLLKLDGHDQFATFREAAVAKRLFVDDNICYRTMEEVIKECMPRECRIVFALLLVYNEPENPAALWEKYKQQLCDRRAGYTIPQLEKFALAHIASILFHHNKETTDFKMPEVSFDDIVQARYADLPPSTSKGLDDYKKLTAEQKAFVDKVLYSIRNPHDLKRQRFFFLQGSGGTGKTFVYNTIIRILRDDTISVIPVASTGIAAILLDGGQTAHSAFCIPIDITQKPAVSPTSAKGQYIKAAKCIIWDEAPMQHKSVLENVQGLIKDLLIDEPDNHHSLFGNKTVILGGDFKQLLPVVRYENPKTAFDASLLNCDLFVNNFTVYTLTQNIRAASDPTYANWISDVGHGSLPPTTFGKDKVQLPPEIVEFDESKVIKSVYPDELFKGSLDNMYDHCCEAALSAPLNDTIKRLNDQTISRLPGIQNTYTAINTCTENKYKTDQQFRPNYDPEQLSHFDDVTIPPQIIRLKIGTVVMLTRNLDIPNGMCNGTRMIVQKMFNETIICKVMTGSSKGQHKAIFVLPNIYDNPLDDTWPKFTRYQLPIRPAFAFTINKSQGQTLSNVGIILNTPCFAHGQFYVAVSRVRHRDNIKIYVDKNNWAEVNKQKISHATNVVFPEVLDAINTMIANSTPATTATTTTTTTITTTTTTTSAT